MTDFWIVGGSSYDNLAATLVVKYFDKQQFTKRNHDKKHFVRNWKIMLSFDQGNIVLNCKTSLCTVNKKKFLWTQKKSWKLVSKRNLSRAREHFSKNAKETENTKMNCFKNIPFFEYPHFPRMAPIRFRCSRNFFFGWSYFGSMVWSPLGHPVHGELTRTPVLPKTLDHTPLTRRLWNVQGT